MGGGVNCGQFIQCTLVTTYSNSRLVIERSDLVRIEWNGNIGMQIEMPSSTPYYNLTTPSCCSGLLLLGFTVSQFLFYSIVPHLLRLASAVVFNLSLLTADIYTLLFGLFLFHYRVSNLKSDWLLNYYNLDERLQSLFYPPANLFRSLLQLSPSLVTSFTFLPWGVKIQSDALTTSLSLLIVTASWSLPLPPVIGALPL